MSQKQEHRKQNERLALRVPEAAELCGVSRALGYRYASDGTWPTLRMGKAVRIPKAALLEWIEKHTMKPA